MDYQYVSQVYDKDAQCKCNGAKPKYEVMSSSPQVQYTAQAHRSCEFAPFNGSGKYFYITEGYGKCN